jgi:hypothetical protein
MSKSIYTYAGVSTLNGEQKLRFANSPTRVKVLQRNGHTDIKLEKMPIEGDIVEAVSFLLGEDWAKDLPCVLAAAKELGFILPGDAPAPQEDEAHEEVTQQA